MPDYFNGMVLLRNHPTYPQTFSGELRFQTLFHIIVIWMSVFIGLSKGLKSYGKVVYLFGVFAVTAFMVFSIKIVGLMPLASFKHWFFGTNWMEIVYNGNVRMNAEQFLFEANNLVFILVLDLCRSRVLFHLVHFGSNHFTIGLAQQVQPKTLS